MALDTASYRLPGVYVDSTVGYTATSTANSGDVKIAIVGKAVGYITAVESKVFAKGSTDVTLSNSIVEGTDVTVTGRYGAYSAGTDFSVSGATVSKVLTTLSKTPLETTYDFVMDLTTQWQSVADYLTYGLYIFSATATKDGKSVAVEYDSVNNQIKLPSGATDTKGVAVSITAVTAQAVKLNDTPVTLYVTKNGRRLSAKQIKPTEKTPGVFGSGVRVWSSDGVTEFAEGTDFVVDGSRGAWTVQRVATSANLVANTVVFIEFSETAIGANETVSVAYSYTPSDYKEPKTVTSQVNSVALFGAALTADAVNSPMAFATQLAFENGANQVVCVPTATNSVSDIVEGIAKLESVDGIDIVVALTGKTAVHDALYDHCVRMSANNLERRAFIGLDGSVSPYSSTAMIDAVKYWNNMSDSDNQRILFVSPSSFTFSNTAEDTYIAVDGYYLCAALAGLVCRGGRYTPITNKKLSTNIIMSEIKSRIDILNESAAGLCVVADKNGSVVMHGKTTSQASVEEQELSVVLCHDYIVRTVRDAMSSGIVGRPLTDSIVSMVNSAAESTLSALMDSGYMTNYNVVSVSQNNVKPTTIAVNIAYKPVYGLNYINVNIAVDPTIA